MNGVQTRFKCKLDVKRCKRFVFPPSSLLPRSNALKTKAIRYFQTDRTLTRIVSPPLQTTLWNKRPDWTFDGADEVDPHNNLIKGRGGAMFKEKLLIKSSGKTYIIVDESKLVSKLGSKYPIPVEVFPHALSHVENEIRLLGASKISLRLAEGKDGPVFTESGNFILDIHLSNIVPDLEQKLKAITGVIESGLFIGYDITVLMANR